MDDYAGAMARQEHLRSVGGATTREDFERIVGQSQPLIVPSLALLARAQRWDLSAGLDEFVLCAVSAAQMYNDLLDSLFDVREH